MSHSVKGILAIFAASSMWGLLGIYYKYLSHIPPMEVLSHRTIWSLVFFGIVLGFRRRFGAVIQTFKTPKTLALIAITAVAIAINWGVFITAIQLGFAVEASFGYYIFPLMAVIVGAVIFAEKISRIQWLAVLVIITAVAILGLGLGATPWISLLLAGTFSLYAGIKKRLETGPMTSVFAEVLLLSPIALIWLYGAHFHGWAIVERETGWFGTNWLDSLMLMGTGPLTAGPLILFSYGATRISLATVGMIQYLNPTLQFSVAVLIFQEPFHNVYLIVLPVIWLALTIYSVESWRLEKSRSKRAMTSATVSKT